MELKAQKHIYHDVSNTHVTQVQYVKSLHWYSKVSDEWNEEHNDNW